MKTLQNTIDGLQHHHNTRNELLDNSYAAIDTEHIQTDNPNKPFNLIAVAFVNNQGIIKAKHVLISVDIQNQNKPLWNGQ